MSDRAENSVKLIEYNSAVALHDDAIFQMPLYGSGESRSLYAHAGFSHFLGIVAMRYPGDFLLDNRAFIQVCGHIVSSCANQFDPTFTGLAIGVGTDKCRQE